MTQTVTPADDNAKPDHFADIAAALRTLAERFTDLIGSSLPPASVSLSVQPGIYGDDDITVRAIDALTSALLGHGAQVQEMHNGTYHYNSGDTADRVGPVGVHVYSSVSTEFAVKRQAAAVLAAKEAELEKLRAEVEAYRAAAKKDASGLSYSREADDPTPVSPARVPLHTGGVTDDGLVDETEPDHAALVERGLITADGELTDAGRDGLRTAIASAIVEPPVCMWEIGGGSTLRRRCGEPIKWVPGHRMWWHADEVWRGHDATPPVSAD